MRRNIRSLSIAALLLCCLLAASAVEAQHDAEMAAQDADKLGLSSEQKARLEALQEDVRSQRRAIVDNLNTLGPRERAVRHRDLLVSERARIKEILTPDQQRKLKDLRYPKQQ